MYPGGSCGAGPAPGGAPGASSAGAVSASIGLPLWNVCQMSRRYPSWPGVCPAPYTGFWTSGTDGGPPGGGGGDAIAPADGSATGWPGAGVQGPDGVGGQGTSGSAAAGPAMASAPPVMKTPATAILAAMPGVIARCRSVIKTGCPL